jgi:peptidyl-prolyl cis-trans isomerase C/foldase protein PrsA
MRRLAATSVAGSLLALLSCGERPPDDPIIAKLGGEAVTLSEFESYVRAVSEEDIPLVGGELKSALLEQFIEELLLLRAAEDEGIEVAPEEVEELRSELVSVPGSEGVDDDVQPAADAPRGRNPRGLAAHLRIKRLMDDSILKEVAVTDEEIASYYENNRAYYKQPEAVDISQVLVEDEEKANQLLAELTANKSRFEELAREHSVGPEAANDGHMGAFRRGELPPSFESEVFGLGKGKLSRVVQTDFGFHIFRVNRTYPARNLRLKEVDAAIRVELLRQKSDEALALFLEDVKRRYPVWIDTEKLDFPYMNRDKYNTRPREGPAH